MGFIDDGWLFKVTHYEKQSVPEKMLFKDKQAIR